MRNEVITVVCLIAMLVSVNYSMDALNWLRARNGIAIEGDAGVSERVARATPPAAAAQAAANYSQACNQAAIDFKKKYPSSTQSIQNMEKLSKDYCRLMGECSENDVEQMKNDPEIQKHGFPEGYLKSVKKLCAKQCTNLISVGEVSTLDCEKWNECKSDFKTINSYSGSKIPSFDDYQTKINAACSPVQSSV